MDGINGLFELFGCAAVGLSIRRLYADRQVHGVSILMIAFFTTWGFWNLFFYPSVHATLSTIGAAATCAANSWYLVLLWKFRR